MDNPPPPLKRICIVGCSGAGKTTLGRDLALRLNVAAVDLDELNWLPNWQSRSAAEFGALLDPVLEKEGWVISGNYGAVRPQIWSRTQAVVWLDYNFSVVMGRLLRRTLRRSLYGEACCGGNRETLQLALSRESVLFYGLKAYAQRHGTYPALMAHPDYAHLQFFRFHSPRETRAWLTQL